MKQRCLSLCMLGIFILFLVIVSIQEKGAKYQLAELLDTNNVEELNGKVVLFDEKEPNVYSVFEYYEDEAENERKLLKELLAIHVNGVFYDMQRPVTMYVSRKGDIILINGKRVEVDKEDVKKVQASIYRYKPWIVQLAEKYGYTKDWKIVQVPENLRKRYWDYMGGDMPLSPIIANPELHNR